MSAGYGLRGRNRGGDEAEAVPEVVRAPAAAGGGAVRAALHFMLWSSLVAFLWLAVAAPAAARGPEPIANAPLGFAACWVTMAVCLAGMNAGRK